MSLVHGRGRGRWGKPTGASPIGLVVVSKISCNQDNTGRDRFLETSRTFLKFLVLGRSIGFLRILEGPGTF